MELRPRRRRKLRELADRVKAWLAGLNGDAFVVSHGGVARALMVLLAGASSEMAASARIPQGLAIVFETGKLKRISDASALGDQTGAS